MLSLANAENVVKPPHSPVVSSNDIELDDAPRRLKMPQNIPMAKHPIRLTIIVCQGNAVCNDVFISVESQYLKAPPIKLPTPTNKIDFSIFVELFQFLAVAESIAYTFAKFDISFVDRIVCDKSHFLDVGQTIF